MSGSLHVRTAYDRAGRDTPTVQWGRQYSLGVRQRFDAEGERLALRVLRVPHHSLISDRLSMIRIIKIGITTAGAIHAADGQIVKDATDLNPCNPCHCVVNCIKPDALSGLLTSFSLTIPAECF